MIKEAINTLVNGKDLTDEVMTQVMEEIMTGEATDAQKASFLRQDDPHQHRRRRQPGIHGGQRAARRSLPAG